MFLCELIQVQQCFLVRTACTTSGIRLAGWRMQSPTVITRLDFAATSRNLGQALDQALTKLGVFVCTVMAIFRPCTSSKTRSRSRKKPD